MLLFHHVGEARSRYSRYLAEILRMEGFVDFAEEDISALEGSLLARHDLVILPRAALSRAQAGQLVDYVRHGGRLIAFLPEPQLSEVLGLRPSYRGLDGGLLHSDTQHPALTGLCPEPVQVATPAISWSLDAADGLSRLAAIHPAGNEDQESSPAVVFATVGRGAAVLVSYDLPYTVARLRQGNPEHVDLCFAGLVCTVGSNLELGIGNAAMCHLAVSTPAIDADNFPYDILSPFFYETDLLQEPLPIRAGRASPPTGPGLGVQLDEDKVAFYRADKG